MSTPAPAQENSFWLIGVLLGTGALGLGVALKGMAWWQVADWMQLPVSLLMWSGLLVMGGGLGLLELHQRGRAQHWRKHWPILRAQVGQALPIALASYLALAFCLFVFAHQPGHVATALLACAAAALVMFGRELLHDSHEGFKRQ